MDDEGIGKEKRKQGRIYRVKKDGKEEGRRA